MSGVRLSVNRISMQVYVMVVKVSLMASLIMSWNTVNEPACYATYKYNILLKKGVIFLWKKHMLAAKIEISFFQPKRSDFFFLIRFKKAYILNFNVELCWNCWN